jgi:hypothetical protein
MAIPDHLKNRNIIESQLNGCGPMMVPFGKFKDQPMEVLRDTPEGRSWLGWSMANARPTWDRYPQHVTYVINNFAAPSWSPEHNRFQVMFLNENFVAAVFDALHNDVRKNDAEKRKRGIVWEAQYLITKVEEELKFNRQTLTEALKNPEKERQFDIDTGFAAIFGDSEAKNLQQRIELPPKIIELETKLVSLRSEHQILSAAPPPELEIPQVESEVKGADIVIQCCGYHLRIEIETSMGDDYSVVMREMKAKECGVLYLGEYQGVGATLKQVIQLFALSNLRVLMHRDFAKFLG